MYGQSSVPINFESTESELKIFRENVLYETCINFLLAIIP